MGCNYCGKKEKDEKFYAEGDKEKQLKKVEKVCIKICEKIKPGRIVSSGLIAKKKLSFLCKDTSQAILQAEKVELRMLVDAINEAQRRLRPERGRIILHMS